MINEGCRNCPVEKCWATYRGSACAANRDKFNLGDPLTIGEKLRTYDNRNFSTLFAEIAEYCSNEANTCISCEKKYCNPEQMMELLRQPAEGSDF